MNVINAFLNSRLDLLKIYSKLLVATIAHSCNDETLVGFKHSFHSLLSGAENKDSLSIMLNPLKELSPQSMKHLRAYAQGDGKCMREWLFVMTLRRHAIGPTTGVDAQVRKKIAASTEVQQLLRTVEKDILDLHKIKPSQLDLLWQVVCDKETIIDEEGAKELDSLFTSVIGNKTLYEELSKISYLRREEDILLSIAKATRGDYKAAVERLETTSKKYFVPQQENIDRYYEILDSIKEPVESLKLAKELRDIPLQQSLGSIQLEKLKNDYPELQNKLTTITEFFSDPKIAKEDTLTLKEMKIILELNKLQKNSVVPVHLWNSCPSMKALEGYVDQVIVHTNLLRNFVVLSGGIRTGDVIFDEEAKFKALTGSPVPVFSRMKWYRAFDFLSLGKDIRRLESSDAYNFFFGSYKHAAFVTEKDKSMYKDEIYTPTENILHTSIDLFDVLTSSSIRPEYVKMLTDEGKKLLQEKWGTTSDDALAYKLDLECAKAIAEEYHPDLKAPLNVKMTSIVRCFCLHAVSHAPRLIQSAVDGIFKRIIPMQGGPIEVVNELSRVSPQSMFCSEFVARVIDSATKKMNENLKKLLDTEDEVMKPLFPKGTNIASLHPNRLAHVLEGVYSPVPLPGVVSSLLPKLPY